INAEDPDNDFSPQVGVLTELVLPGGPGVRVDTHVHQGYSVPPFYDSLLAKLLVHGTDRTDAIARMLRALSEFTVGGLKTTIPFHQRVLADPTFVEGRADTTYVDTMGALRAA